VRGFEIVASVIVIFFVVGIGVGVLLVVALPALRSSWRNLLRRLRYGRRNLDGGNWQELPPPRDDREKPPRWPGG
jgi:hypothetical protein